MHNSIIGLISGLVATAPMTLVMQLWHRRLPQRERYPLPPRQITMRVAETVGLKEQLDEPQRKGLTLAAHFGFGAAAGALYASLTGKVTGHPALKGVAFGVLVWTVGYLGLLPGLHLLRPATEHPARRNELMIGAHLVWGAVLGLLVNWLAKYKEA